MFKPNTLFYSDGYKVGHKRMLAPGTTRLYGTWIPRSLKYAAKGITKVVSIGQQLTVRWLHDEFKENFFSLTRDEALKFGKDISLYLGLEYDASHFGALHDLGYLPIKIKALPEGIETNVNIPHMTFINTVDGFAWLTLYLETVISSLSWKMPTSAALALLYKRNLVKWVAKTDPNNAWLIPFLCHDFSARGLDPFSMLSSGLGHASVFRGSDTLIVIPGARYFYDEPEDEVCINSVNASEHSVSTTKIFTVGERQMLIDWLKEFPTGILSIVADTFDLWQLIGYLKEPEIKELILARDGKLVIRPDSGDPVDIVCGTYSIEKDGILVPCEGGYNSESGFKTSDYPNRPEVKGVIELLWDVFGGTVNEQGYKVLDPHIGAIYGDSITPERQVQMYERLAAKGFACTNIVLGIGSFTYQFNTRDTAGYAAKASWFEIEENSVKKSFSIYKEPITDSDKTKKSLRGLCQVILNNQNEFEVKTECSWEEEAQGLLHIIYEDGQFYNQTTLTQIREKTLPKSKYGWFIKLNKICA